MIFDLAGFHLIMIMVAALAVVVLWLLGSSLLCFLAFAIKRSLWIFKPKCRNPFSMGDAKKERQPLVMDREKRDQVLKQRFNTEKVPDNLDAVVIGSGIGGLTVAAILSRAGKRVLVLEQHDKAGGCSHTHTEKGFEFDAGVHYVGGMNEDNPSASKILLDQISDGQIRWQQLSDNFDTVHIANLSGQKSFDVYSNPDRFMKFLASYFPNEKEAIEKYFEMVEDVRLSMMMFGLVKLLPQWLIKLLSWTRLIYCTKFYELSELSLQEVLNKITDNEVLKTAISNVFAVKFSRIPHSTKRLLILA